MYLSTLAGRFIEVDPLLAAMLGYASAHEMVEGIRDIGAQLYVEPDARAHLLDRLRASGSVCNFETRVYRKDGDAIWVSEYCRAVHGTAGGVAHLQGAFADISSYKDLLLQQMDFNAQVSRELAQVRRLVAGSARTRFPVKDGTRVRFIETAKIKFIKADGDYVNVYTVNGEHAMARDRISNVEQRIDSTAFVRISKSAMVNLNHIREMRPSRRGNYEFMLEGGELIASGPTYRDVVRELLDTLRS